MPRTPNSSSNSRSKPPSTSRTRGDRPPFESRESRSGTESRRPREGRSNERDYQGRPKDGARRPAARTHGGVVRIKTQHGFNHPWIFQKMIERQDDRLAPGIVEIQSQDGEFLGRGLYNGHSPIALRILTQDPDEQINAAFFEQRIGQAAALRRDWLKLDVTTDCYRIVHAEGDGLSGLVIDKFGDIIVTEYFSAVMWQCHKWIQAALEKHYPNCVHYWFSEENAERQEHFVADRPKMPPPVTVNENGLRFRVDFNSRHKTGFFNDQRENRARLATFSKGARVLDLCCNSGGFAVYAKSAGAGEVIGVDLDADVIQVAKKNADLNQQRIKFVQADIFPYLRDLQLNNEQFDVVILDPAKMTRNRDEVIPALKKYLDMNKLAMSVLKPGGLLLTCSCTGLVDEPAYLDTVRRAGFYAERDVQIFAISGAAADHPWMANVPESRYLKAVWCRVW
jgi:23S rRNA (cytosine1962-C5)-methyltransferase